MFAPGDVVICVDASPKPHRIFGILPPPLPISEGRIYRVREAVRRERGVGIKLWGINLAAGPEWYDAFRVSRFRKIDAPDTEISKRIRACKPMKVVA